MGRRLSGVSVVVLLVATTLSVTSNVGVAWAAKPDASGTVTCKVTGSGTFSPKLTLAGSPGGVKFTFTAKASKCKSNATIPGAIATITGATVTASGYWNGSGPSGSSCASLPTDTLGTVNAKYVWTSAPPIANTNIATSGGVPWLASGPSFKFDVTLIGASITSSSGSFSPATSETFDLKTNIANPCGAGWGPYPTFNITGGSFTVN